MTNTLHENALEECRFCESEALIVRSMASPRIDGAYAVLCKNCGCHGPIRAKQAEAIADWNTDALKAENQRLRERLAKLVEDVDDLIANSEGVIGLHLNGDDAPWDTLLKGGRFEDWLIELARARAALTEQPQ